MTASAYINQAARAAAMRRPFNLTMTGYQAAWQAEEAALMAARPAEATCACASCGDVYDVRGLSAIESDHVYVQAGEEACFDRDGLLCKSCRTHFETRFGTPRADCHNILDVLYGVHDTDR